MKTYLVTGCAGFIGSNFVHYMLEKYQDIRLVNLDKLTYAGNLENLEDIKDDARHIFVKGDICDKALVTDLIAKYDPDYVINFAAESHVDRSIRNPEIFVESNVLVHKGRRFSSEAAAKTFFYVFTCLIAHRVAVQSHKLLRRVHVNGRIIIGERVARPLLSIVQRGGQVQCVRNNACRIVQHRVLVCALPRVFGKRLRVFRVLHLLRIPRHGFCILSRSLF